MRHHVSDGAFLVLLPFFMPPASFRIAFLSKSTLGEIDNDDFTLLGDRAKSDHDIARFHVFVQDPVIADHIDNTNCSLTNMLPGRAMRMSHNIVKLVSRYKFEKDTWSFREWVRREGVVEVNIGEESRDGRALDVFQKVVCFDFAFVEIVAVFREEGFLALDIRSLIHFIMNVFWC